MFLENFLCLAAEAIANSNTGLDWKIILGALGGLIGILATSLLGRYQQAVEIRWRKSSLASDFITEWDERTSGHREIIEKATNSNYFIGPPIDVPQYDQGKHTFAELISGEDGFELKQSVMALMNWFEDLAYMYLIDMINRDMVDETLKVPVVKFHAKIAKLSRAISEEYRAAPTILNECDGWPYLTKLINRWAEQDKHPLVASPWSNIKNFWGFLVGSHSRIT